MHFSQLWPHLFNTYQGDQNADMYILPELIMARHVLGLNHIAIGIEHIRGMIGLSLIKEQLKPNVRHVAYLSEK